MRIIVAITAFLMVGTIGPAYAEYPDHQIRVIFPYTAGGPGDAMTRTWTGPLGALLGQEVFVDNRPGAGSNIGIEMAARAAPDGYTLLSASASFTANPFLYKRTGYDPLKDFIPVAPFTQVPNILIVPSDSPFHSVTDIVTYAKANPGKLNFGSSGPGGSIGLAGETLKYREKIEMTDVAYRGAADAEIDLMGGRLDFMFDSAPSALVTLSTGRTRAVAIASDRRIADLPDLPTTVEQGYPYLISVAWVGVMVPVGTPTAIVTKLNSAIINLLKDPAVLQRIKNIGGQPWAGTPQDFADFIKVELARNATVIEGIGLPKQ